MCVCRYLYTGKIDLPPEDIFPIVCLADKYDVVHLKTFCQEKLKKSLKQCPDMSTMITWCKCAMQRDLNDLKEFCLQFIANNICILISSVDNWLTLETDILFELLKRDDIVVDNEFILVEALEKWLEHPVRAGHIRENVSKVLQLIRFPMIHPRHLASLEMSDINISFGDLCGPFIMDAYRFHAVPLVHRRMDNLSPNSVPRNYTGRDNNISTNIRVDGFRDLKKMDSQLASLLQTAITSSFADSNGTQRLCFNLDFYPKGYFKTVKRGSRFGSKVLEENSQTTLILGWSNVLGKASVEANVLVYAYQDGQRYVAYSLKSRRDLTSENPSIIFQNVVDLKELSRMDSPYLMNGSFEIRVILRLLEYEHRQDEIHHRSESKR